MIDNAELTIYLKNGEDISFELSPMQLVAIVKLLGIEYNTESSNVNMFSDDTLKTLVAMKGNPLRLQEKE